MATLKDKVTNALSETRTLILGAQILLGFQFHAVFRPGYERLPLHARWLELTGLGLMVAAVALLIAPAPFHRISERARDTPRLHGFTTTMAEWALVPVALCIGTDIFIVAETLFATLGGAVAGIAFTACAAFFWYGFEYRRRRRYGGTAMSDRQSDDGQADTDLGEKIKTLMTETRVILPGAQALLGFQFIAFLSDGFLKLPRESQLVHFAALACVTLATILLIAPAAFHRVVAQGEDREDVDRVGSALMLAALPPLALGVCGDFYIVARKVGGDGAFAIAAALVALAVFLGLWLVYPVLARTRRRRTGDAA